MRLTNKVSHAASHWALALGLVAVLGGCGRGADNYAAIASANSDAAHTAVTGPAGDYPVVLGDPYSIDGQLYTPVDTMSYDQVGYAASDTLGGTGVTASHKTLPLPSYVEVTSLVTGKTILARVERRGPMTGDRVVALSPGAQAQLGSADGAPVRVRRVNPPEVERAKLRMSETAPLRMETPQSLVAVLKRKLPARGSADLGRPSAPSVAVAPISKPATSSEVATKPDQSFDSTFKAEAPAVAAKPKNYALAPLDGSAPVAAVAPAVPKPKAAAAPKPVDAAGKFVVQAAAFSNKTSAQKVASSLGGFIMPAGKYYRVRVGPFTNRGQADAALAKVRAAGYSDARVSTAG